MLLAWLTSPRAPSPIYNCVNPTYSRWETDWPPVAAALLAAAESSGAVLATVGNLYGYGKVDAPMTEETPLAATGHKGRVRNAMWRDALAAHEAGRIRTFEVRGSDYLGGNSLLSVLVTPALRKGRRAYVPADLDAPHTWTCTEDVAALLVTGVYDERAWGRPWHVPSDEPRTLRELTALAATQLGAEPKLTSMPGWVLWTAGLVNPMAQGAARDPAPVPPPVRPRLQRCAGDVRTGSDPDRRGRPDRPGGGRTHRRQGLTPVGGPLSRGGGRCGPGACPAREARRSSPG